MAAMSRNTIRITKTKRIFLRRSGSLKARRTRPNIKSGMTLRSVEENKAARVMDTACNGPGKAEMPERIPLRYGGVAHELHPGDLPFHPTDNALLEQRSRVDGRTGRKDSEDPRD